ncbi:TIGR01906 family membrane protein [Anaerolentibacter hominis]|uniref:TIGR01906 family membrane protein n=1 Tax=Anaerolentibacter hominis TaxID=3079009 RepID=UPI0031B7F645
MKQKPCISNMGFGIGFLVFSLSVGVIFILLFRPFYYLEMKLLDIPGSSGLSAAEIRSNYRVLMDYLLPFTGGELAFPTLKASAGGLKHFAEVKQLIRFVYAAALGSGILLSAGILRRRKKRDYSYLKTSARMMAALPVLLGLAFILRFSTVFSVFHRIFFRNDLYLFDPAIDPVILILPETFFMHCGLVILAVVLTGSFSLWLIHHIITKKPALYVVRPDRTGSLSERRI